jgi:hypothetical protein
VLINLPFDLTLDNQGALVMFLTPFWYVYHMSDLLMYPLVMTNIAMEAMAMLVKEENGPQK